MRSQPPIPSRRPDSGRLDVAALPATADASRLQFALALAIVAAAVLWTHAPALSARALSFDDHQYLVANRLVRNPSWDSVGRFMGEVLTPSTVEGYYQPLTMISLMLDCCLGGNVESLAPFHATSLALHVANTLLIVVLLCRLFGRLLPAAACGLLFGLHPMTVETLPWIGERKTLLCTFFALLAMLCYVAYARRPRGLLYAAVLACFGLSLLAKPTSTPLPLMMLLMDVWPLGRFGRRAILEKVPFFAVAAASAVITYVSQARTSGVILPTQYGPLRIPFSICHNMVFYIVNIMWPMDLSSHYPIPAAFALTDARQLAYVTAALGLVIALTISLRWTRAAAVGYAIFLVGLLPTMQIVGFTTVIASDKYAYLPALGLLMFSCWGLTQIWIASEAARQPAMRWAVMVFALMLAASEAFASRAYLRDWRDTETLFSRMIRLAPNAPTLYTNLGNELLKQGRVSEALEAHAKAIELGPNLWLAQNDYGNALFEAGRFDEAIERYRASLRIHPGYALARSNLGIALLSTGRADEAMRELRHAIELEPKLAIAHYNLARGLAEQGADDAALACLNRALELDPEQADAHNDLGVLLAARGRRAEAIAHFREAIRLRPGESQGYFNLGRARQAQGDTPGAAAAYREALRLDPADADARRALEELERSSPRAGGPSQPGGGH